MMAKGLHDRRDSLILPPFHRHGKNRMVPRASLVVPPERCPSGLRSTPGKCVYGNVSRVRIPPSPPDNLKFKQLRIIPDCLMSTFPRACHPILLEVTFHLVQF